MRYTGKIRSGFTLTELIVVIALISVLFGVLLFAVTNSQRSAQRIACQSSLHQLYVAVQEYAAESGGYWPVAYRQSADDALSATREWCWLDYISKYVGPPLNQDGSDPDAYSGLKQSRSVLWGCPSAFDVVDGTGYAMNPYPKAAQGNVRPLDATGVAWTYVYESTPLPLRGQAYRASAWTNASQRALLYDSISLNTFVGWPWWVGTGPMPKRPDLSSFTPDFRRHLGAKVPSASTVGLNCVYCDGHAESVSAAQIYQAIAMRVVQ